MSFVDRERQALADTLIAAGPSAPTLCEGWDAHDLAAHLWARESQSARFALAMANPAKRMEVLLRSAKQRYSFDQLVEMFRNGPQGFSPWKIGPINKLGNVVEFFVHNEDVRRAGDDPMEPREFSAGDQETLTKAFKRMTRLLLRKVPFGVDFVLPDDKVIAVKRDRKVGVHGPIGEIILFTSGRADAAQVEVLGSPENVALLKGSLGY